jgi:hypothetical protein
MVPSHGSCYEIGDSQDNATQERNVYSNGAQNYIYNGPTNALFCIKTLIQMSHTKTFKITPTCFDHQMMIIRELSDPATVSLCNISGWYI